MVKGDLDINVSSECSEISAWFRVLSSEEASMERMFGQNVNVVTNAVEGLFGRLKKYLYNVNLWR